MSQHDDIDGVWDPEAGRYFYPEYRDIPVTREEEEWCNEVRPWNLGSHGERVLRKVPAPPKVDPLPESAQRIARKCDQIKAFLIEKNLAYGNSALDPINIFSNMDAVQQMEGAIDHKLSRMARGHEFRGDDTILDLAGYLILYLIAKEQA